MSSIRNIVTLFNVIVIRLCPISYAAPIIPLDQQIGHQGSLLEAQPEQLISSFPVIFGGFAAIKDKEFPIMMFVLFQPPTNDLDVKENDKEHLKIKFKRQGAGKFSQASKLSPSKIMQLYVQMFKNLVSGGPADGPNPISPESVKPIVKIFKQGITSLIFPEN